MKKKNSPGELSLEQKKLGKNILLNPILFAIQVLGVELWDHEIMILRSIQQNTRTAIKACHGIGKTFTLAVVALWWLARYPDGIVLTTSPTQRQVRTQLWSEIHRLARSARVPYPKLKITELKFRGENNYAIGFSTDRSANFQGYHGNHVLIIADEAPGLEAGVFDAIAGTMAGGVVHIVMAGNPTVPAGPFYDAFTKDRELWNCFSLSAFDSPNMKGIDLEELLAMDPAEGGPLDQNLVPYLVNKRWVYDQRQSWFHGSESNSPNWQSRVMAQFPDQAQHALFRQIWLERASKRTSNPVGDIHGPLVAGVDVGGRHAETVVYVCESKPDRQRIIKMGAWRGEDTRGEVVRFLAEFRGRLSTVRVDEIGIGHNFGLHLRDERFPVQLINVSLPCESRPTWGENDPARRFTNLRALFYQTLADAFEHDQIDGLADELTIGQLASVWIEIDSHGRLKIESKENARSRGVPSPDRADALMLALGRPPWKLEILTTRDLHKSESNSTSSYRRSNPFFGFDEIEDDDGDDTGLTMSPPSRWDTVARGSLARMLRKKPGAW